MSFFKETSTLKGPEQAEQVKETDHPKVKNSDNHRWLDLEDRSGAHLSDVLSSAFKALGLTTETNFERKPELNESTESNDNSTYLEKGDDGKYYNKENGKAYDSIEAWEKAQEILAKRYEGTSKYYEEKAKKEYAYFENAEQNGESYAEKWEHYRRSQEYYAKAKECKEKVALVREKLVKEENVGKSDAEQANEISKKSDISDVLEKGKPIQNKIDGLQREAEVKDELEEKYLPEKGYNIISEAYLRDAEGNIVKDPETGKARRIDFVVVKGGKVLDSIEVTSKTADKSDQLAKENRVRESGGNYVRDNNGNLIKIPSNIQTRVERRD